MTDTSALVEAMLHRAHTDGKRFSIVPWQLESWAVAGEVSVEDLLDVFARHVATSFNRRGVSFEAADLVMNALWAYASAGGREPFDVSDLFHGIMFAFDEGEYRHIGDQASADPVTRYTRPMVRRLLERAS